MSFSGAEIGTAATAFAASFVEFVEALSVVLAVGTMRGWRQAGLGAGAAVLLLAGLIAAAGPALGPPPAWLRLLIGLLSLQFGLRWLQKSVLRAAGRIKLRDEKLAYANARARLAAPHGNGFDAEAVLTSFQVVLLEGVEVLFIVMALAAARGALRAAAAGAGAALAAVIAAGIVLHRPLAQVPENRLKFAVGTMMSALGTGWTLEALGAPFPLGDLSLLPLAVFWAGTGLMTARALRPAA